MTETYPTIRDLDGLYFRYERGLYPSYCPGCGAKVVSDARD